MTREGAREGGKGREGTGRDGKGTEGKGREAKRREGKGKERKGREGGRVAVAANAAITGQTLTFDIYGEHQ